ncbi:MAG TPA: ThuA domain-containing protein [Chthonomonadaceae bacterium]|nr:ThuA domain-containing protein [Chthonomonadaceae bacterium]
MVDRRAFLRGAAGLGTAAWGLPLGWTASADGRTRRLLVFTRSQGYEHQVVKRAAGKLSLVEQTLTDLGKAHGFDVVCTKDGAAINAGDLARFDALFFYTTGDLTRAGGDGNPPMTPAGKVALLDAIAAGKGFVGAHAATDTFLTDGADRYRSHADRLDPYIAMIGAEFIHHDQPQKAHMRVADRRFPGFAALGDGFDLDEEWYSHKDFAPNLHVLLVQETAGMVGPHYRRAPYPATWARMHGKGRVFYTSMGHRETVWANPTFQAILLGGIAWATRSVNADVTPNLASVAPGYREIPADPAAKA